MLGQTGQVKRSEFRVDQFLDDFGLDRNVAPVAPPAFYLAIEAPGVAASAAG
ncbi:MAG: hypothetical protein AVDCRST_MAG02-1883 [uncultured Rubrobacteraceae bacterium]|uniref:Uncharacterized protein n=1 Tax=uncultured Rubrobacteraceae bacterium TaxID=349277 RepID=A0A6J4R0P5_9ACTN|nr:MAG: hypothetical protein AVDCRST_MAG02-1883 [uncultured Rubrobacteraceae bacterium]